MMTLARIVIAAAVSCAGTAGGATGSGGAELRPVLPVNAGENRIVFVGGGMVEQARLSAQIEARLLRSYPDRAMTCRNLGWSGDSVWGTARTSGYERPGGLDRLMLEATELKPTAIFVAYGQVESFDGDAGLGRFTEGYKALLDRLGKITPNLVLMSPTPYEGSERLGEDGAARNRALERYGAAIAGIATERKLLFVDVFHPLVDWQRSHRGSRLTSNGVALNEAGYWLVADEIERQLGLRGERPRVEVTAAGAVVAARSATVRPEAEGKALRFGVTLDRLPAPVFPGLADTAAQPSEDVPWLRVAGLGAGMWALVIDGQEIAVADGRAWDAGVTLPASPDRAVAEELRRSLIHGNELFYRRSRPFNDHPRHWTYINDEHALYDKQLVEQDKGVQALRRPPARVWAIVKKQVPQP